MMVVWNLIPTGYIYMDPWELDSLIAMFYVYHGLYEFGHVLGSPKIVEHSYNKTENYCEALAQHDT